MLMLMNFRNNHVLKIIQNEGFRLTPLLLNHVSKANSCKKSEQNKNKISYKPYVAPCYIDHDHKNMTLGRPMSPHLTIYAPTLPAMTSIWQRITGVTLASYAILLSGGALFLPSGIETYVGILQSMNLSRPMVFIVKLLIGAPFAFHYFNGIRFCAWNAGRWLSLKEVYSTAHKSWIAAALLALLFAML